MPAHAQSQSLADGPANQAIITQIGEAQRATIEQRNILGGLLNGSIQQNGVGNEASILLKGGDLSGGIMQNGNDNQATLEINGERNNGAIQQRGDGNIAGLQIGGYGTDVTLIQNGTGPAYSGPIKVSGDAPGGGLPITIQQY